MSRASSLPTVDRDRLADYLDELVRARRTVTYHEAAVALGLEPPQTIHRLALALEDVMTRDAERGEPLRAALVVSRVGSGTPAPGFFAHARSLGVYDGPDQGSQARNFHREQLAALGLA